MNADQAVQDAYGCSLGRCCGCASRRGVAAAEAKLAGRTIRVAGVRRLRVAVAFLGRARRREQSGTVKT